MKHLFLFVGLLFFCASCFTLHPHISTITDPFTNISTRYMSVSASEYESSSTFLTNFLTLKPDKAALLGYAGSNYFSLSSSQGDTLLNYSRLLPESRFDVPDGARLLILLKDERLSLLTLPIVKSYHTINGPIFIRARVDQKTLAILSKNKVDGIRIDRVSTNESDELPVTWYWQGEYPRLFQEGVDLFMGQSPPPPAPPAPKPKAKAKPKPKSKSDKYF